MTGQYRKFWHSWNNMVEKILDPCRPTWEIHVSIGLDWTGSMTERNIFQTHIEREWELLQYPPQSLILRWIDKTDPLFLDAVQSLEKYKQNQRLSEYWFDYLVFRSGSCLEYVQILRLYKEICSRYEITKDDMLIRTRTDILLRHSLDLDTLFFTKSKNTFEVFQQLFPTSIYFAPPWKEEPQGRETSIFPSCFQEDRWVISLRKNLFYIMPMRAGGVLQELVSCYGDWDKPEYNAYWFNAESQFRGCFRMHHFTVWEYSQQKDECYGDFENLNDDFPIYAIYR